MVRSHDVFYFRKEGNLQGLARCGWTSVIW